jgi:FKBP-type peptidyl-prolyl cis-trans isomerase
MRFSPIVVVLALVTTGCHALWRPRSVTVDRPPTTTTSGVVWREILVGTGEPARAGDKLTVEYVARLADGKQVFSTADSGIPATFRLGTAPVRGWNEALLGMRKGGKRSLEVPSELAYGSQGIPGLVPPDSRMLFEVELVEISP